jgi:hypothetical protein
MERTENQPSLWRLFNLCRRLSQLPVSFLLCILSETGLIMRLMTSCSQLRRSHQECITKTKSLIAGFKKIRKLWTFQLIEYYEAMSVDSLISSSGGLLGIWAGMSFLTIFQAISFLLRCAFERTVKKPEKLRLRTVNSISADLLKFSMHAAFSHYSWLIW